jgi:hypothetical protein
MEAEETRSTRDRIPVPVDDIFSDAVTFDPLVGWTRRPQRPVR